MAREDDLVICRCEEVTKEEIEKAIEDGARTVQGIKNRTRAGMGLCQGKTCYPLVRNILADRTKQKPSTLLPFTCRPPVRVLNVENLMKGKE